MSSSAIRVSTFKDSHEPFVALLRDSGLDFSVQTPPVGVVMNSGFSISITVNMSAAAIGALAQVICAFLKNRRSRKVMITAQDNTVFQAEGLGQAEIEHLIPLARNMVVIETARDMAVRTCGEPDV